jgi:GDP-L-fucose synthase
MKILVTGSNGLVGNSFRRLSRSFPAHQWIFATRQSCNLTDATSVLSFFRSTRPDIVIHLAAKVGGLFMNIDNNLRMYTENAAIDSNIIQACVDTGVSKCVMCLSTCVFPDCVCDSFSEEDLHRGEPHDSNNGYAYAKRITEILTRLYMKSGVSTKFYCVSPTNMYGPNDNFNLQNAHVVPALIMKAHRIYASESEQSLHVYGSGEAKRQFMYVDDLATVIMKLLFEYEGAPGHFIVAPPDEHSINQLAEIICEQTSIPRVISHTVHRSGDEGQRRKFACANKLLSLPCMEDFQFTPLPEGIRKTIQWLRNNYEDARM